jgi:signal peptidase I
MFYAGRSLTVLLIVSLLVMASCTKEFHVFPIKKYIIPQNGMYPSLPANSTFWAKRKPYLDIDDIKRGDIIVFYQIIDQKTYDFVWRVIGVPGDVIQVSDMTVSINGSPLSHKKTEETAEQIIFKEKNGDVEYRVAYNKEPPSTSARNIVRLTIPQNEFFVLGDNRDNASDSRFRGTVAYKRVIGKKL